jgi:hypothetical protein
MPAYGAHAPAMLGLLFYTVKPAGSGDFIIKNDLDLLFSIIKLSRFNKSIEKNHDACQRQQAHKLYAVVCAIQATHNI